jgi:hypothetical protein
MKKLVALTLAVLLVLSATFASAATYSAGNYYTLDYDDSLTLDHTTYNGDTTDDYIWLFMLYNEMYMVDAALEPAPGYEGVSLYEADEDAREAYVAETLDTFADSNAAYVDALTSVSGYPFYVYSMEDSDGVYYYGETIISGTSVNLCCYYFDTAAKLDDTLLEAFERLLITIRPVDTAGDASADA